MNKLFVAFVALALLAGCNSPQHSVKFVGNKSASYSSVNGVVLDAPLVRLTPECIDQAMRQAVAKYYPLRSWYLDCSNLAVLETMHIKMLYSFDPVKNCQQVAVKVPLIARPNRPNDHCILEFYSTEGTIYYDIDGTKLKHAPRILGYVLK